MFALNKLITGGTAFAQYLFTGLTKASSWNRAQATQPIAEWLMGYAYGANFGPTLRNILSAAGVGRRQVSPFTAFSKQLFKLWLSVHGDTNLYNIESVALRNQFEADMAPATVSGPAEATRQAALPAAQAITSEQGTYYTLAQEIMQSIGWMPGA